MKTRFYFFILSSFLTFSTHAQFSSVKKNLAQKPMQDRYVDYLNGKGYSPEVDSDGDVKFKYKNLTYYVTLDTKDPNFFRVAKVANLNLTTDSNIARAKEICHDLTKDLKVTKVYWSNGQIWASSEQMLGEFHGLSEDL